MPRFAANLSMLYNDVDFLDRFSAAAQDGFKAEDINNVVLSHFHGDHINGL
eukprot:gene42385-52563_t